MDVRISVTVLLLVAVILLGSTHGQRRDRKQQLQHQFHSQVMQEIRDARNKDNPPPPYPESAVNVNISFSLLTVTDLNVKKGYVDLEGHLSLTWIDPRFRYNHDNLKAVRVNPKSIWTPDLELYNAVQPGIQIVNDRQTALIYDTGSVYLVNHVKMRSNCDVLGQRSAFRPTNCTVTIGSWAYSGNDLMLRLPTPQRGILTDFKLASSWNVTSATSWAGENFYSCCPEPYPWVKYSFLFEKRSVGRT
ncbi:acetylcholine receptor subunit alpha-like [Babylonia areolata]|uniref:acetylcholine receptor subunit alpha-like n=1 Tax=Babylonia areolata TaxID=304850 RepID=UPI003FD123D0